MATYQKLQQVGPDHLDELNHVNNVQYLAWVQDVSKEHWMARATLKMLQEYIWVVREHRITYHGAAIEGDTIRITTHIIGSKGPISTRKVVMEDNKTGRLLVSSETDWCLLSPATMKPVKMPDAISQLFETR
ncbi:MAG: acyl-CoA thioesterase [Flavobacteriaceae bacterium]|nr:acyl-CoA thioesterase [Flavobacteriaceae bacterium]